MTLASAASADETQQLYEPSRSLRGLIRYRVAQDHSSDDTGKACRNIVSVLPAPAGRTPHCHAIA
jgi:hypothetical protein